MASMRVHELAKEFDMTSKELLDRLHEMKIPAKSHASMLADAYVDKIRKNLSPEIKQRAGKIDAEEAKQLAEEKAQEERKKAEEEANRRAAVEKERALREAERARREGGAPKGEARSEQPKHTPKKAPVSSGFEGLASQIESEKERVAREKAEARQGPRCEDGGRSRQEAGGRGSASLPREEVFQAGDAAQGSGPRAHAQEIFQLQLAAFPDRV